MTQAQLAAVGRGGRMVDQPKRGRPILSRFFSVLKEPQTGRNLVYLIISFPLGIAYFVALVTAISTSAGLLITVVGAPLLIVSVYLWCFLGDFEAVLTNQLLGVK